MKAVCVRRFAPFAEAAIEEVPVPAPERDQVLVRVEAIETNYPDILVMEGKYQVKPPLPFIPGKGLAGTIEALGPGVTHLEVGQRIAAQLEHGAYAEMVCAPSAWCYPVPDSIAPDIAAASVLTYQTAWFALTDRAAFKPGERVLVLGAGGGVGIAAIQLAKALGAALVVGGTRGQDKAAFIREAGADDVVDLSAPDLRNALRAQIHALTHGAGVDIVIDPIGGEAFEPALRALAWRGRYVVVGFAGGQIPQARTNYLLVRNIGVLGLQASDYRDREPETSARAQATIFRLIERGSIAPKIGATYPLRQFAEALRALASGSARGKLILKPRAGDG